MPTLDPGRLWILLRCSHWCRGRRAEGGGTHPWLSGCWMRCSSASSAASCLSGSLWSTDRWGLAQWAGEHCFQHPDNQHWHSPKGVCSAHCSSPSIWMTAPEESSQTFKVKVCRRHSGHWPHPGWWQVCIQTGGWTAGPLVWSEQPGAEHAQNCGDGGGLLEEPHNSAPFTILNSTVSAVETFRFLGSTLSQYLK